MTSNYGEYSEDEDEGSIYTDDSNEIREPVRKVSEEKATGEVVIEKTLSVKDQVKNFAHLRLQDILRPQGFIPSEEPAPVEASQEREVYDYSLAYNNLERDDYSDEDSEYDEVNDEQSEVQEIPESQTVKPQQLMEALKSDSESVASEEMSSHQLPISINSLNPNELINREPSLEYQPFIETTKNSPIPESYSQKFEKSVEDIEQIKEPSPILDKIKLPNVSNGQDHSLQDTPSVVEAACYEKPREYEFEKINIPKLFPKTISPEPTLVVPKGNQNPTYQTNEVVFRNQPAQTLVNNNEIFRAKSDLYVKPLVESEMNQSSAVIDAPKRRQWKPFMSFDKDTSSIKMPMKKQENCIYFGDDILNSQPGGASSVCLRRTTSDRQWGFTVHGGKEFGCAPFVSQVIKNSISEQNGIEAGDIIEAICGQSTYSKDATTIKAEILRAGNELDLIITKNGINLKKLYKILPKLQEQKRFAPTRSKSLYAGSSSRVQRLNPKENFDPIMNTKSLRILENQLNTGQYPSSNMETKQNDARRIQPTPTLQGSYMPTYGQGSYPARSINIINNNNNQSGIGQNALNNNTQSSTNWSTGSNCFALKQETLNNNNFNTSRHIRIANPEAKIVSNDPYKGDRQIHQVISNQTSVFPAYSANQDYFQCGSQSVPMKPRNQNNMPIYQQYQQQQQQLQTQIPYQPIVPQQNQYPAYNYSNVKINPPMNYNTNVNQYQNLTRIPEYPQSNGPQVYQRRPHTSTVQFELYSHR